MPFYDIHSFIKTQGPLVTTNFYKVTVVVGVWRSGTFSLHMACKLSWSIATPLYTHFTSELKV